MKIDIYKSLSSHTKYLSVPSGTDLAKIKLTDKDFAEVSPFKSQLRIERGEKRIALDSDAVIDQIEKDGYSIHGSKITIQIAIEE